MVIKATHPMVLLGALFAANQAIAGSGDELASSWDGQYVGFTLGASRGTADPTVHAKSTTYFILSDASQLDPEGSHNMDATNVSGSLFWGLNRQKDNMVYGVELNASFTDYTERYSSGDITYITLPSDSFTITTTVKSDFSVSLSPRLGYASNKSLFYVTAGPALRQFKYDFEFSDSPTLNESASLSKKKWALGWTAGMGFEHTLHDDWSLKAGYLYSFYNGVIDTETSLKNHPADGFTHKLDFTEHNISMGLSKRF